MRFWIQASGIGLRAARCLLGIGLTVLTTPAIADAGTGINGGQLVETANRHIEFIGGPSYSSIMFALSDARQKPIRAAGSAAYAIIAQNQKEYRIALDPDGENWLSANLPAPLLVGASILVVVEMASGEILKAQFETQ